MSEDRERRAEEGRHAFMAMLQGFQRVTAGLERVAAQLDRSAQSIEVVNTNMVTLAALLEAMNRHLKGNMDYSAALQEQIAVLVRALSRQPALPIPQQPSTTQALAQTIQGLNGVLGMGGGRPPGY